MGKYYGRIKGETKEETMTLVKKRNTEMTDLCRSGLTRQQIAEKYGLSTSMVQKICNENGEHFKEYSDEKSWKGIKSAWTTAKVIEWTKATNRLKKKKDRIAIPTPEQALEIINRAAGISGN